MAIKVQTIEQTAVVIHPKDPEVQVTVRKLQAAVALNYFMQLNASARVIPLRGEQGELLRDKRGNVEVHKEVNVPVIEVVKILQAAVVSWTGVVGSDGSPLPYEPRRAELLLSPSFNWFEDANVDGEDIKVMRIFWQKIVDAATSDGSFDDDPKG